MELSITTTTDGKKATIVLVGKLSVTTSPQLEEEITKLDDAICDLDFDLAALDYISSAGLRVLVAASKMIATRGGSMHLLHPTDDVLEVFDMTGLSDIFEIEE